MINALPQEFPRELAQLRLDDVLPELPPPQREAYHQAFLHRQSDPLYPQGILLVGANSLRPLMALMRLVVLRFRDLNLDRFPHSGGDGRLLNAYVRGGNLESPLPTRAAALFIESAEQALPHLAPALTSFSGPIFASWTGPSGGPIWTALMPRSVVIHTNEGAPLM